MPFVTYTARVEQLPRLEVGYEARNVSFRRRCHCSGRVLYHGAESGKQHPTCLRPQMRRAWNEGPDMGCGANKVRQEVGAWSCSGLCCATIDRLSRFVPVVLHARAVLSTAACMQHVGTDTARVWRRTCACAQHEHEHAFRSPVARPAAVPLRIMINRTTMLWFLE